MGETDNLWKNVVPLPLARWATQISMIDSASEDWESGDVDEYLLISS